MIKRLPSTSKAWACATIGALLMSSCWRPLGAQETSPPQPVPAPRLVDPLMPPVDPPMAAAPAPQSKKKARGGGGPRSSGSFMVSGVPITIPSMTVDPNTPLKELLPAPPKAKSEEPSAFVDTLDKVPEIAIAEPIAKDTPNQQTIEAMAWQIAKINHLNKEKSERFMEALLASRSDLAGLPFQMGNDCRQSMIQSRYFKQAAAMVHAARTGPAHAMPFGGGGASGGGFGGPGGFSGPGGGFGPNFLGAANNPFGQVAGPAQLSDEGSAFLVRFLQSCLADDDAAKPGAAKEHCEHSTSARIAAMTQICGPTSDSMKLAMARYLASVSSVDSTRALVKTILFTPEDNARNAAIEALKARRDKDYVDALLEGFRYPWPDVAKRTADALVKLDRKDLVPRIIDVLDEADPRAPITKTVNGKSSTTVRELVRINHHRNCVMCHAPAQDAFTSADILTAQAPIPGQPFPIESGYGSQVIPQLAVRIDVTYLRQDFSMMLPVADAAPWPEMQRFDFAVRTRTLKDDEVNAYKDKFEKLEPGVFPPNHRAALTALRELTGKDTAPTANAWRTLVKGDPR